MPVPRLQGWMALVVLCCAVSTAPAQLLETTLRPVRVDSLHGTTAEHFADLEGRVLLVELFGFW